MIDFLWTFLVVLACLCGALLASVMWLGKELRKFNKGGKRLL